MMMQKLLCYGIATLIGGCTTPEMITSKLIDPHKGKEDEINRTLGSILDLPINRGKAPSPLNNRQAKKFSDHAIVKIPRQSSWMYDSVTLSGGEISIKSLLKVAMGGRAYLFSGLPATSDKKLISLGAGQYSAKELLDMIAYQHDIAYRVSADTVIFQKEVTKGFKISVAPGERKAKLPSFNEGIENYLTISQNPYAEAEAIIRSILGDAAAGATDDPSAEVTKVASAKSSNTIYVTGSANQLREVELALASFNKAVSRSIRLSLNLFIVDVKDSEKEGIDWSFLYNNGGLWDLALSINNLAEAGLGATGSPVSFRLQRQAGSLNGSNFIFNNLKNQGKTKLISHPVVVTRNNEVVDIRSASVLSYIDELQQTTTSSEGLAQTSTNFKKATFIDGLTLWILPTINKERISLLIGLGYQDLQSLDREIFADGSHTTLPQYKSANFRIPTEIRDGETLVIAGIKFERGRAAYSRGASFWTRILDPFIKSKDRETLSGEVVITITAELVE